MPEMNEAQNAREPFIIHAGLPKTCSKTYTKCLDKVIL